MIKYLSDMSGRGTELVSVYIPKGKQLHEVTKMLQNEQGTASNIKSDTTRNHVMDSLGKIVQKLKSCKTTPKNGICVFCGPIYNDGDPLGSESVKLYSIEPARELHQYLYRCDDHFHLDILKTTLNDDNLIGFLALDTKDAGWGILSNAGINVVDHTGSGVPGKHRQGGQSAKRFQKLREMHLSEYYRRVADITRKHFLDSADNIKGIIVSGPGHTKDEFIKNRHLEYRLQNMIIGTIDCSYSGYEGVREAFEKSADILSKFRLTKEKKMIEDLFQKINSRSGFASYGINDVVSDIKNNIANLVLVNNDIEMSCVTISCMKCGVEKNVFVENKKIYEVKNRLKHEPCGTCHAENSNIDAVDIVDYLAIMCSKTGITLEVVSGKSEYGISLKSLGDVGATLRYKK